MSDHVLFMLPEAFLWGLTSVILQKVLLPTNRTTAARIASVGLIEVSLAGPVGEGLDGPELQRLGGVVGQAEMPRSLDTQSGRQGIIVCVRQVQPEGITHNPRTVVECLGKDPRQP